MTQDIERLKKLAEKDIHMLHMLEREVVRRGLEQEILDPVYTHYLFFDESSIYQDLTKQLDDVKKSRSLDYLNSLERSIDLRRRFFDIPDSVLIQAYLSPGIEEVAVLDQETIELSGYSGIDEMIRNEPDTFCDVRILDLRRVQINDQIATDIGTRDEFIKVRLVYALDIHATNHRSMNAKQFMATYFAQKRLESGFFHLAGSSSIDFGEEEGDYRSELEYNSSLSRSFSRDAPCTEAFRTYLDLFASQDFAIRVVLDETNTNDPEEP